MHENWPNSDLRYVPWPCVYVLAKGRNPAFWLARLSQQVTWFSIHPGWKSCTESDMLFVASVLTISWTLSALLMLWPLTHSTLVSFYMQISAFKLCGDYVGTRNRGNNACKQCTKMGYRLIQLQHLVSAIRCITNHNPPDFFPLSHAHTAVITPKMHPLCVMQDCFGGHSLLQLAAWACFQCFYLTRQLVLFISVCNSPVSEFALCQKNQ